MRKVPIFQYYAFGYDYGLLQSDGYKGEKNQDAINALQNFFSELESLDLRVTLNAASNLKKILTEVRQSNSPNISEALAKKIQDEVNRIDPTLDAELALQNAYVLTERRYANDKLINSPDQLLSTGVFNKLSDTSKRDFSLACVQIAYSQPTAAAFHLMRALEEQVKMLYFGFKKTKRMKKPMWGPMTNELRNKRSPKPSEKLLNHLDGIRVHFRNPTQHPEAFYSIDEAQDLLNQTISAINLIDKELPTRG